MGLVGVAVMAKRKQAPRTKEPVLPPAPKPVPVKRVESFRPPEDLPDGQYVVKYLSERAERGVVLEEFQVTHGPYTGSKLLMLFGSPKAQEAVREVRGHFLGWFMDSDPRAYDAYHMIHQPYDGDYECIVAVKGGWIQRVLRSPSAEKTLDRLCRDRDKPVARTAASLLKERKVSKPMPEDLQVGQAVEWDDNAGGRHRLLRGTIVLVVPACADLPRSWIRRVSAGGRRPKVSYVVDVDGKLLCPKIALRPILEVLPVRPMC